MGNKSDGYLYKNFGLTRVNTAQDLKRKAHPYVSCAVLAGGICVALVLFFMHRSLATLDHVSSIDTQEAQALIDY